MVSLLRSKQTKNNLLVNSQNRSHMVDVMNEIWWSDVFAPKLVPRKVVSLVQGHCQLLQSHDGITVKKDRDT